MKLHQVMRVLSRKVAAQLPVLLVGAPGVGKTDIVFQAAKALNHDIIVSHPVVEDPTDAKGLPYPDKKGTSARFLPYGVLAQALEATKPTIWFLDDLGQATPAVQAAYMQLLLARRIGEHVLPDCITFVAATNRKQDRAGVSGLLEPVKSRFNTILQVEPDLDAWLDWAISEALPPELLAFLQMNPELFFVHKPTTELVNSPSPRTWHNVAKAMEAGLDDDPQVMLEELAGTVGQDAATQLVTFLQVHRDLPGIDELLLFPDKARIPQEISTLWMVSTALASRATEVNFGAIGTYANRLVEAGHGEVAAFLVRKCVAACPAITNTSAYVRVLTGPVGEQLK